VLRRFLRALTTGVCGEFNAAQFEPRAAWLAAPVLGVSPSPRGRCVLTRGPGLVAVLREHVMRLYTGLLLRKRIVIYAPTLDALLPLVRYALPVHTRVLHRLTGIRQGGAAACLPPADVGRAAAV
jgi:hypothetical protein